PADPGGSRLTPPRPPELEFVLEADSERRRRGHGPRVAFAGRGPADPEHRLRGALQLPRQREPRCASATFRLH
ncbi:ITA7 protein, partial [Callaeas wilsoni]|nr:ITA7 protein [Callaeas wilsoni]